MFIIDFDGVDAGGACGVLFTLEDAEFEVASSGGFDFVLGESLLIVGNVEDFAPGSGGFGCGFDDECSGVGGFGFACSAVFDSEACDGRGFGEVNGEPLGGGVSTEVGFGGFFCRRFGWVRWWGGLVDFEVDGDALEDEVVFGPWEFDGVGDEWAEVGLGVSCEAGDHDDCDEERRNDFMNWFVRQGENSVEGVFWVDVAFPGFRNCIGSGKGMGWNVEDGVE